MKIGLDIHGVITDNPKFFAKLTAMLLSCGAEIHIMTGPKFDKVEPILRKFKIKYTHFYSIVEEQERLGRTKITWDKKGDPFMDSKVWDAAKSKYAKKHKLDLHIDDSTKYAEYFTTPFMLYKNNSPKLSRKP